MVFATSSLELTRTDGTRLYVEIKPVTYQQEGKYVYTGVYQLLGARHNDPAGEYTEDNPGNTTEIGSFAHKQDDKYEWVYLGDYLDEEEQSQIADHIRRMEDKDESAASFYAQAFYHGGLNSFEVKANENSYTIAYNVRLSLNCNIIRSGNKLAANP